MAEMRVQCPNCQAKMKLTAAIEKVRCPKCDALFDAAANRSRPGKQKSASSRRQKPSTDPFGFEEEDDDLFGPTPTKRKRSKPSSKPSPKKRSSRRQTSAIPAEQLRKFGGTMMLLGVGAFVLPLIGLQIKGLNALSPEMQSAGGVCFLILGVVLFGISYLEHLNLGGAVENGFQFFKWGAIGLFVLLFGAPILFIGARAAINAIGGGDKQEDMDRIVEDMHDDAMQHHRDQIDRMNQTHREMMNAANRNNSSTSFFNESDNSTNESRSTQPAETTSTSDPSSPFHDVTPFEPSSTQSGHSNSSQMSSSTNTGTFGGQSSSRSSENKNPFISEPEEEVTVIVNLEGFSRSETSRKMFELRKAAETFRMRPLDLKDGSSRIEFQNVKGIQAFADRISFGTVTNVDTEKNEITVEQ